mmetsp:Transcript_16463/g.24799  ORF Transcript_16463/g.24799 Transcript_16463/m.24799 type:complete len:1046 (+) Transcript_16463:98-3235(+)
MGSSLNREAKGSASKDNSPDASVTNAIAKATEAKIKGEDEEYDYDEDEGEAEIEYEYDEDEYEIEYVSEDDENGVIDVEPEPPTRAMPRPILSPKEEIIPKGLNAWEERTPPTPKRSQTITKARFEQERVKAEKKRIEKEKEEKLQLEMEMMRREAEAEQVRREAERKKQQELERKRKEQEEQEKQRLLEQERLRKEEEEKQRLEQEKKEKLRLEQEKLIIEQEKKEKERIEQEEKLRFEKERIRLEQEKTEKLRLEREEEEKLRKEQEEKLREREEQQRIIEEKLRKEKEEQQRLLEEKLKEEELARKKVEEGYLDRELTDEEKMQYSLTLQCAISTILAMCEKQKTKKAFAKVKNFETEILDTEQRYIKNLDILEKIYLVPIRKQQGQKVASIIAGNLTAIRGLHNMLLPQLQELHAKELKETIPFSLHGSAILLGDFTPYFKMYTQYLVGYNAAADEVNRLKIGSRAFVRLLKSQRKKGYKGDKKKLQDIVSYLIMPCQRISRYRMLLEGIIHKYPHWISEETKKYHEKLIKVLEKVKESASHNNEMQKLREKLDKVREIHQRIIGPKPTLVAPSRIFVMEGSASITTHADGVTMDESSNSLVYLFNDMLVWTTAEHDFKGALMLNATKLLESDIKHTVRLEAKHSREILLENKYEENEEYNTLLVDLELKDEKMYEDWLGKLTEQISKFKDRRILRKQSSFVLNTKDNVFSSESLRSNSDVTDDRSSVTSVRSSVSLFSFSSMGGRKKSRSTPSTPRFSFGGRKKSASVSHYNQSDRSSQKRGSKLRNSASSLSLFGRKKKTSPPKATTSKLSGILRKSQSATALVKTQNETKKKDKKTQKKQTKPSRRLSGTKAIVKAIAKPKKPMKGRITKTSQRKQGSIGSPKPTPSGKKSKSTKRGQSPARKSHSPRIPSRASTRDKKTSTKDKKTSPKIKKTSTKRSSSPTVPQNSRRSSPVVPNNSRRSSPATPVKNRKPSIGSRKSSTSSRRSSFGSRKNTPTGSRRASATKSTKASLRSVAAAGVAATRIRRSAAKSSSDRKH